jgi:hypothetical protein
LTQFCSTKELIESIRNGIEFSLFPRGDITELCNRAEYLLSVTGRLERALHDAIKVIENLTEQQSGQQEKGFFLEKVLPLSLSG